MKIAKSSSKRKKRDYSSDSSVDSGSVSSVSSSGVREYVTVMCYID